MNEFLIILGMFLVTFGVRYPVLVLVRVIHLPELVAQGLKYVPLAVISAIIMPAVFIPGGEGIDLDLTNTPLLASVAATLVAWRTKNLLATIIIGMAALWLLKWLVIQ
jgi:branched-subunit amino acid transport protein